MVRSNEWLDTYYSRVSGSTAATAVGLDPYKTRSQLALNMREPKSRDDLSALPQIRRGVFGESAALFALQEAIGIDIRPHDQNEFRYNDDYPHAHCLPDGWADSTPTEVKCSNYGMVRKCQQEGIPSYWLLQAQHNMAVLNTNELHFGTFNFDHQILHYETVTRNDELIAQMMGIEAEFLAKVKSGEPVDDATPMAPEASGQALVISDSKSLAVFAKLLDAKARSKATEEELELLLDEAKSIVGEQTTEFKLEGLGSGTWRTSKPGRKFDAAACVKAYPDAERFYSDMKAARPFIVRALKEKE